MDYDVKFKSYEDREKAASRIYDECGGSGVTYGYCTSGDYYYFKIDADKCTNFGKARQNCQMYGGEILA